MIEKLSVIPEPVSFEIHTRESVFFFNDSVTFEAEDGAEKSFDNLLSFLQEVFFFQPLGMGRGKIRLEISGEGESEGYFIRVEQDRAVLRGNDEKGLFYAVQTFKQLLFSGEGELPGLEIHDKPRFSSRGFMLDCSRYFFTVEAVKQFLDMMALHKLNEFHWHLSDDQGFRCQLEGKLLLTEIGSYRSHTNFNSKAHEGFYTRVQMKEIISYAHDRYIRVIPEIDTPGHALAMLAAYPELACFPQDYTVATSFGVKHDVLCPGKESTFVFMQEVFDELSEIFTDGVIHLGGDEVPTVRWEACPDCRKRMADEGFLKAKELHTYYLDRMASYLRKKGIEVRMWNDSVKGRTVSRSVTWQLWNGEMSQSEVAAELEKGRKFVISLSDYCYLDLPYALTSLEKSYSFEPVSEVLSEKGEGNILGVEGCLWTELVPDMLTADKMTYPRLAAISESAWSPREKKDFNAFSGRLNCYYKLLGALGVKAEPVKKASPSGVRRLAGRLYWERRKLYWGAHDNIISDRRIRKITR